MQVGCSRFSRCCHLFIDLPLHVSIEPEPGNLTHAPELGLWAICFPILRTDGQLRLRKILILVFRRGGNLLHCRSPFYLCLEHPDNLGAYSIPSETGLLIPSVCNIYWHRITALADNWAVSENQWIGPGAD